MNWEYVGLTKHTRHTVKINVNDSFKAGRNRLWVQNPRNGRWDIGFRSYDRKGIVYWDRGWQFYPIVMKLPIYSKFLGKRLPGAGRLPFEWCLGKAISVEKQVVEALESVESEYYIHHLALSGVRSHGADIIITKEKEQDLDVFENVKKSYCAIEVLGSRFYHGKYKFTYHGTKNFYKWMTELNDHTVVPVIGWVDHDNNVKFMFLTLNSLTDVFFYRYKDGTYRQRTNYSPLANAAPYTIDAKTLLNSIDLSIRPLEIIEEIKNHKPLRIGIHGDTVVLSAGWECKDIWRYDQAINKIKEHT